MTPTEVFISVASIITIGFFISLYFIVKKATKESIVDVMPVARKEKIVAQKRRCNSCDNIIIPEFDGKVYTCPICSAIVSE